MESTRKKKPTTSYEQGLKGFLVSESGEEVRVRVDTGTWVISPKDIESMEDWRTPPEGYEGKPVQVTVRQGAELGWLQTFTVESMDLPLTLPNEFPHAAGTTELQALTMSWANGIGFTPSLRRETTPSYSAWVSEGGWGLTIKADDCQD